MSLNRVLAVSLLAASVAVPNLAAADAKAGKKVFRKCSACHTVDEGKNRVGPSLYKIVGAEAGAVDGFKYSSALTEAGLVWDAENLTAFLTNPKEFLPGNKMSFRGLPDAEDIANLILYLEEESAD